MKPSADYFERQSPDTWPADTKIRLLGDRILVKPLDWSPSVLETVRFGRAVRGLAVQVGPGEYPKRYLDQDGNQVDARSPRRCSFVWSKTFLPTTVRPGDVVNWGGLNIYDGRGYQMPEILIGNVPHLIISEKDCVIEDA